MYYCCPFHCMLLVQTSVSARIGLGSSSWLKLAPLWYSTSLTIICPKIGFYPVCVKNNTSWRLFRINIRQKVSVLFQKKDEESDQIRSVTQLCLTLCDPMNRSTPGLPVHHQLPEFTQIHVHQVSGAMQPTHPLSSPSPLAPNPSQHQSLFQWVNSSREVAKVLEFQL